ncbi:hypothetical protein AB0L40_16340 [Patulibacter sp. NPDC049589]|uniref:hypothetical protein n=1 Tax=Patulibacter sp. NPDC049589 TaxID=3154731 RepID=UPI003445DCFA
MSSALVAAGGLTACGRVSQDDKPNGSRPPQTLQISAAITDRGVNVSPGSVGGGPIRLVISNQSSKAVTATLAPAIAAGGAPTRSTNSAIPPGGVAALQATVTKGTWRLQVGLGIASGKLKVGKTRKSSDGELLLP